MTAEEHKKLNEVWKGKVCINCGRGYPETILNIEEQIHHNHGKGVRCLDVKDCNKAKKKLKQSDKVKVVVKMINIDTGKVPTIEESGFKEFKLRILEVAKRYNANQVKFFDQHGTNFRDNKVTIVFYS